MPHLGLGELIVIFMLAFLVFGATRLPQIGEGMGKAIRNFRRGLASNDDIEVSPTKKRVSSDSNGSQTDSASEKAQL